MLLSFTLLLLPLTCVLFHCVCFELRHHSAKYNLSATTTHLEYPRVSTPLLQLPKVSRVNRRAGSSVMCFECIQRLGDEREIMTRSLWGRDYYHPPPCSKQTNASLFPLLFHEPMVQASDISLAGSCSCLPVTAQHICPWA